MATVSEIHCCDRKQPPGTGMGREYQPPGGDDRSAVADLALLRRQLMHDVRGDLVSLAMVAKLLLRGRYGFLPPGVKEQIGALEKKADAAAGLLSTYCRLATAGDNTLVFEEEVDFLRDVIPVVEQELSLELASKAVTLACRAEEGRGYQVHGNKLLLQSVFRALLHNAVKHANPGSTIVCIMKEHEGELTLSLANDGLVVPIHLRQRIFEEFVSAEEPADADSSRAKGLGLGLFLARHIINKHDGDIRYEPEPTGSRFVLSLPAAC